MASLDGIIYLLNQMESPELGVDERRCICVRNRNTECLRCAHVCTSGAISLEEDHFVVKPELCIGCGTCATACPTGALQARNPSDEELSDETARKLALSTNATIVIACGRAAFHARASCKDSAAERKGLFKRSKTESRVVDENKFVEVVCLGRIDEALLMELALRGAKHIILADHDCRSCKHRSGGKLSREVSASAISLLEAFGFDTSITHRTDLPKNIYGKSDEVIHDTFDESRRAFLSGVSTNTKGALGAALDKREVQLASERPSPRYEKVQGGTLSQQTPLRRVRLFNCMRHMGSPLAESVNTRLWGQVSIDKEACDSCRMCTVFCPTGALAKTDAVSTGVGIAHRPALCMQCRLCESVCPNHALSVSSDVSFEQFRSGAVELIELARPSWQPNRPESMFEKSSELLGGENLRCF